MASILNRATRIGKPFYDKYAKPFYNFNFRMWKDYPVHYLSVLCVVPCIYILFADADARYMEAEKLAGPPVCSSIPLID
jgi:hypothetical protein